MATAMAPKVNAKPIFTMSSAMPMARSPIASTRAMIATLGAWASRLLASEPVCRIAP